MNNENCIGRRIPGWHSWLYGTGPGPCDYMGGGLLSINPVRVEAHPDRQNGSLELMQRVNAAPYAALTVRGAT